MSMQDPVADMLTRVRNAQSANKEYVDMPHAKLKAAIAEVLREEGYIVDFTIADDSDNKPMLRVHLKYHLGAPVIDMIKRVSKPSLRVYRKSKELPTIIGGLGISIISTHKGVMSGRAAKDAGLGGEVLCIVA